MEQEFNIGAGAVQVLDAGRAAVLVEGDQPDAGAVPEAFAGVAVIAAIAVGAYVYMRRAKDSADSAPMAEVEVLGTITGAVESGALKDAAPVPSAPPLMPPPPPTGRNFCSACGAPVRGPFCSACGARA